jgi:hypothetical protein
MTPLKLLQKAYVAANSHHVSDSRQKTATKIARKELFNDSSQAHL